MNYYNNYLDFERSTGRTGRGAAAPPPTPRIEEHKLSPSGLFRHTYTYMYNNNSATTLQLLLLLLWPDPGIKQSSYYIFFHLCIL